MGIAACLAKNWYRASLLFMQTSLVNSFIATSRRPPRQLHPHSDSTNDRHFHPNIQIKLIRLRPQNGKRGKPQNVIGKIDSQRNCRQIHSKISSTKSNARQSLRLLSLKASPVIDTFLLILSRVLIFGIVIESDKHKFNCSYTHSAKLMPLSAFRFFFAFSFITAD